MTKEDNEAVTKYFLWFNDMSKPSRPTDAEKEMEQTKLKESLSEDVTVPGIYVKWIKEACETRDSELLDSTMTLGWILKLFDEESVKLLTTISLENWVCENDLEDMTELIETYGGDGKVDTLARMAIQKYPGKFKGEPDAVPRKCMWALHRLYEDKGNLEALEQIKRLAVCGNRRVERLAKHHLYDYFHMDKQ